ncbi:hypothetical protein ACX3VG_07340 [Escherichia coli]
MLRYIAKGKEEGARVLCGGDVLKGDGFDNGAWVAPRGTERQTAG